ncbi:hypothetical protein BDV93DRAFT_527830 [Ceratobasidium sp. AG-I]|nr:hypothetical protein BDV93DRAFT_527830 [Ceratobasidium sp. AG-I]
MSPDNHSIHVKRITISPLYPVLDEKDNSPGFRLDLPLYDEASPEVKNPCTIDMTSAKSRQIKFHCEFPANLPQVKTLTIEAHLKDHSHNQILVSHTAQPDAQHKVFTVDLKEQRSENQTETLPWGLKGQAIWQCTFKAGDKTFSRTITHPLEVYAVSPFNGSRITRDISTRGLPRAALEFYIFRSRELAHKAKIHVTDLKGYVAAVVNAVFSGGGYAYDTVNGSSHYTTSGVETYFNVNLWARHITVKKVALSEAYHVNCYDQAAAVFTGVILALTGGSQYKKLVWHYAQPFGFINEVPLVGWGKTNSPYFSNDTSKMIIPAVDGVYPDTRTAFWNHAFLTFNDTVLDATCGPHVGHESLHDYLEKNIDHKTGKTSNNETWANRINESSTWRYEKTEARALGGATVSNIDARQPVGLTSLDPLSHTRVIPNLTQKTLGTWFGESVFKSDSKQEIWGFGETYAAFEASLAKKFVESGVHKIKTQDVKIKSSRFLQCDKTLLSWEAIVEEGMVSIDVHICNDSTAASNELAKDLNASVFHPATSYEVPKEPKTPLHLVGTRPGKGLQVFVLGNVFVKVRGLSSNAALQSFVSVAHKSLSKVDHAHEAEAGDLIVKVLGDGHAIKEKEYQAVVGDLVTVEVSSTKGTGFSVEASNRGEFLFPTKSIQKDHKATFSILARHVGHEQLKFTVRNAQWVARKSVEVSFAINEAKIAQKPAKK